MLNQSYEEYIRSILGYPNFQNEMNYIGNSIASQYSRNNSNQVENSKIEDSYPEIYKVVYPMIKRACAENIEQVTPSLIDKMTNEIYSSIEVNNPISVNINLTNGSGSSGNRANPINKSNSVNSNMLKQEKNKKVEINEKQKNENRGEERQFNDRGLRDLIRILLIREFLGRPPRPPFPGNPPFPGRPPFPGNPGARPPMRPRSDEIYDIYEY